MTRNIEGFRYPSLSHMWLDHVTEYKSRAWTPLCVTFTWHRDDVSFVEQISPNRVNKRLNSYLIPGELERSSGGIRFGHEKTGQGYHGKRGDFCLLAANYKKGHLTIFYRALEMIGGLHFDLPLYGVVEDVMGPIKRVTIYAAHAFVFGVKGKKSFTKERLYEQVNTYHEMKTEWMG